MGGRGQVRNLQDETCDGVQRLPERGSSDHQLDGGGPGEGAEPAPETRCDGQENRQPSSIIPCNVCRARTVHSRKNGELPDHPGLSRAPGNGISLGTAPAHVSGAGHPNDKGDEARKCVKLTAQLHVNEQQNKNSNHQDRQVTCGCLNWFRARHTRRMVYICCRHCLNFRFRRRFTLKLFRRTSNFR